MSGGEKRTGECRQCGRCCKVTRFAVVLDNAVRQHGSIEDLKIYFSYRGIRVINVDEKNNRLYYEMNVPCDKLNPDNKCSIHDQKELRPFICEKYPWFQDNVESCGYGFEKK